METTKFILHILNKMRILGHVAVTQIECHILQLQNKAYVLPSSFNLAALHQNFK